MPDGKTSLLLGRLHNATVEHRSFNDEKNITFQWKKHNPPWIGSGAVSTKEFVYISRDLDTIELGGGRQDAVVIGIGQHFRALPIEVFVHRILKIRHSILRLQARSPQTKVFIKLENTRELGKVVMTMTDWYGRIQNLAQRTVFGDLRLTFLDAWDFTLAANTFNVHPNEMVVSNE
ncbi:hypothetical protein JZ751_005741, partial [Albula glossodonta]